MMLFVLLQCVRDVQHNTLALLLKLFSTWQAQVHNLMMEALAMKWQSLCLQWFCLYKQHNNLTLCLPRKKNYEYYFPDVFVFLTIILALILKAGIYLEIPLFFSF